MNSEINRVTVSAMLRGYVDRASLMANMSGFEDACQLVHRHALHGRIGVHLNISEGLPLTSRIGKCHRFCDAEGRLRIARPLWHLSRTESAAVESECEAQIGRIMAKGIVPTHLDTHHHMHWQWGIVGPIIRMAKRYSIPAVRIFMNCGSKSLWRHHMYALFFNSRLQLARVKGSDFFASADELIAAVHRVRGAIEVMVHARGTLDCITDLEGIELEKKLQILTSRLAGKDLRMLSDRLEPAKSG